MKNSASGRGGTHTYCTPTCALAAADAANQPHRPHRRQESVSDVAIDASYSIHGTLFFISTKAEVKRTPFLIRCARKKFIVSGQRNEWTRRRGVGCWSKSNVEKLAARFVQRTHRRTNQWRECCLQLMHQRQSSNVDLKICFLMPKNKEINDVSFLLAKYSQSALLLGRFRTRDYGLGATVLPDRTTEWGRNNVFQTLLHRSCNDPSNRRHRLFAAELPTN